MNKYYRVVEVGETVEKGDQVQDADRTWFEVNGLIGHEVTKGLKVRRLIVVTDSNTVIESSNLTCVKE